MSKATRLPIACRCQFAKGRNLKQKTKSKRTIAIVSNKHDRDRATCRLFANIFGANAQKVRGRIEAGQNRAILIVAANTKMLIIVLSPLSLSSPPTIVASSIFASSLLTLRFAVARPSPTFFFVLLAVCLQSAHISRCHLSRQTNDGWADAAADNKTNKIGSGDTPVFIQP